MKKLDNIQFLFGMAGAAGATVGLIIIGVSINPISALQGFLVTFGLVAFGGVGITTFKQFDIRYSEELQERQTRLTEKMKLIERAQAVDMRGRDLEALEIRVDKKLKELEDKSNDRIESEADRVRESNDEVKRQARQFTDDRPTGHQ
jgi:hypothetical protein